MAGGVNKPAPVQVGPLRCRADGRRHRTGPPLTWYWRIFLRDATVWSGWETREGVTIIAARLVAEDSFIPASNAKPRTVGELLKVWVSHYRRRKDITKGTIDIKRRNLRHLLAHLDSIMLTELAADDVDNFRDARLAEGHAPGTIVVEHRTLAQAWRWGKKRTFTSGDVPKLTIQLYTVYNHRTPTDDEIDAVIACLAERESRRVNAATWPRMFVLLEKETGARLEEIATLTWGRVDLNFPKITVLGRRTRKSRGKDNQPRTIPISKGLADELRLWALRVGHRTPDATVLGVTSKTCRTRGIWHIGSACVELGIEPFTNHGLRRRAIRRFRKKGVTTKEAAVYFGHSEIVMLQMYDEVEPGDLEAAVAKVYGVS